MLKKADVRGTDVKELHLGGKSAIDRSNEIIPEVRLSFGLSASKISELKDGDRVLVRATIVQTFPFNFFPSCPSCRKRLAESEGKFYCAEHKETAPKYLPVFSFYIDDGSANIRAIAFLDQICKILEISEPDVLALKDNEKEKELRNELLGTELFFEGRSRKNPLFSRLEMVVNAVNKVDIPQLIEDLSREAGFE